MAVLMTAAPSETEEVFTTAFPPAKKSGFREAPEKRKHAKWSNL